MVPRYGMQWFAATGLLLYSIGMRLRCVGIGNKYSLTEILKCKLKKEDNMLVAVSSNRMKT